MTFRHVTPKDYPFLYELLKSRRNEENISHKELPTWEDHVDFNDAKPYKEDYIILNNRKKVGRVYIRHPEVIGTTKAPGKIGIHTLDGSDEKVLQHFKSHHHQAEVSPKNKRFIKILERNGYKLLHHTYGNR